MPAWARDAEPTATFDEVGLDSLAFLQLQSALQDRYGFELPDERAQSYRLGEITAYVNAQLHGDGAA